MSLEFFREHAVKLGNDKLSGHSDSINLELFNHRRMNRGDKVDEIVTWFQMSIKQASFW